MGIFPTKKYLLRRRRNHCCGTKTFSLKKRMYTHTQKKMWDFYESYPVIFHFFPATSFLEQNPRKPKKTICAVSKNFAKLNYIIHLADLMSSWMQFANLHFGHKEIMHLLYMKKKFCACYKTLFCNYSGMSLYIYIVHILRHEIWLFFM